MPTLLIQTRRDTAANWANANTVLASGELALETDTCLFKFGNGTAAWNNLQYTSGGGPGTNMYVSSLTFLNSETLYTSSPHTSIIAMSSPSSPIVAYTSSITGASNCYNGPAYKCNQIAYNGSLYVAAGQAASSDHCIQWSADFSAWHPVNLQVSTLKEAKTVLWDGALWWAGGSGHTPNAKLYTSPDGSNWTQVIANATEIGPDTITDIAYNGINQYVIVGEGGTRNTLACSYISSQTILFNDAPAYPELSSFYKAPYTSIKYLNGLYVAANSSSTNQLIKSSDGINWAPILTNFSPNTTTTIATNGAYWLASGLDKTSANAMFIQSADGTTWTNATTLHATTSAYTKLSWTGANWIAASEESYVTSSDGIIWTTLPYSTPTTHVSALTGPNALFEPNAHTSSIYYTSTVINSQNINPNPSPIFGLNPSKIRIVTATPELVQSTLPSDELLLISTSANTNQEQPTLVLDPTGFIDGQHIKLKLMANSQPITVSSFGTNPIDGATTSHSMLLTNGAYKNLMYFQHTWYNLSEN
jgi:hypothetical protein